MSQSRIHNATSKIIPVGTVLSLQDIIPGVFVDNHGKEQTNDKLLLVDQNGNVMHLSFREYNKMKTKDGEKLFSGEPDSDDIILPNKIEIISMKGREDNEQRKRFPTYAYVDAQKYIDSKGEMSYSDLIDSGLREDNPFDQLQNYVVVTS